MKQTVFLQLLNDARKIENHVIDIRRRIHAYPELAFKEFNTSKIIATEMKSLGLKVTKCTETGVIGLLEGSGDGSVVGLRADMDALPLQEEVNIPFRSGTSGVMHACGHDAHVAMLLGAARILAHRKAMIKGQVKFIFQPAEEDPAGGGALAMIADGVLEDPPIDYVFGLHLIGNLQSGHFGICPGPAMAAADSFKIMVVGSGGHAAAPHETKDPIFISTVLITSLYGISSRMRDPTQPFVISVCRFESGTKENIIPDYAVIEGTIRSLDEKLRKKAKEQVRRIATSVCKTFGASCEFTFGDAQSPVLVNDPVLSKRAETILHQIPGTKVTTVKPILGGEDFSQFLLSVPGVYYFLGTRNTAKACVHYNHSSKFRVDESVLKYGVVSHIALALDFTGSAT